MYFLSDDDVQFIRNLRRTQDGISGPGVSNDGQNIRIAGRPPRSGGGSPVAQGHGGVSRPQPLFKLVGNATRPGVYTANPVLWPDTAPDPTLAIAFSLTDVMKVDTTVQVYLFNMRETDKDPTDPSQHDLDTTSTHRPQAFLGLAMLGIFNQSPVWLIDGRQSEDCS